MSVERISQVLNCSTGLTSTQKLILIGIANHDGDGGAWPSIATLARYAEASERTVQRAIGDMVDAGVLAVEVRGGGTHRTRNDRRPNRYEIHLDGVTSTADAPGRGDIQGSDGVTSRAPRGDIAVSPEPSYEPSHEPSDETLAGARLTKADAFAEFWSAYIGAYGSKASGSKGAAFKAWQKMAKRDMALAMEAVERQSRARTEQHAVPHASTWLNNCRWLDDELQVRPGRGPDRTQSNPFTERGLFG